jgi:K(+)-stimulated pyrophosphate-energized sodium pump
MQELSSFEQAAVWAVLGVAIFGIAYAFVLRAQILAQDKGTARMQEVWGFIKDGANAYLSRQFRTIAILIGCSDVCACCQCVHHSADTRSRRALRQ